MRLISLYCLGLLLSLAIAERSFSQKKIAFVVGNAQYSAYAALKNPVNDAILVSNKLRECGFEVMLDTNLTRRNFSLRIDSFYNRLKKEFCIGLFYYSGHGLQQSGENFLVPVDAVVEKMSDVELECVPMLKILSALESSQSIANIIIIDACRKDPFSQKLARGEGEKGLSAIKRAPKESFIAFATAPGEIALDGGGKNSPFSASLATHMTDPDLAIEQLFKRVNADVKKVYPGQIPWINSALSIDFFFNQKINLTGQQVVSSTKSANSNLSVASTENCYVFINGDSIGLIKKELPFDIQLKPGRYKLIARSVENPNLIVEDEVAIESNKEIPGYKIIDLKRVENQKIKSQLQDYIRNGKNISELDPQTQRQYDAMNSITLSMINVDGGSMDMGSRNGKNDEAPIHNVELLSFQLSKYEVSQREWVAIMGNIPQQPTDCDNCPVVNVSWDEVQLFITKLNQLSSSKYRLPTEAEWEYAARGGKLKMNSRYSGSEKLDKYVWCYDNAKSKIKERGSLATNEIGIYDMSGNVAEWCNDWYNAFYYQSSPKRNPPGADTGKQRVVRGGSADDHPDNCRTTARAKQEPASGSNFTGFRLAK